MNKLILNEKARNHFRFLPLKDRDYPIDEGEQIKYVENLYNELVSDATVLYEKVKKGSHSIKAIKCNGAYYIVISIRNEFGTYNNTIYEISNENDCINVAKWCGKNIRKTMSDYKKQILDANKMHIRKEVQDEREQVSEDNQGEEIRKESVFD